MPDEPKKPRLIRIKNLAMTRILRASCDVCGQKFDKNDNDLTMEEVAHLYKVPRRIIISDREAVEMPGTEIELIVCSKCINKHGSPVAVEETWRFKDQVIKWAKIRLAKNGN